MLTTVLSFRKGKVLQEGYGGVDSTTTQHGNGCNPTSLNAL